MSRKDKLILILIGLVALFLLSPILLGDISTNDCPAPEDLESMEVYTFLRDAIHENMTPEEIIESFAQMCEMPVECWDDQILVESSHWEGSDNYNIHLARQFQFSDSTEFVQLHLDIFFSLEEMKEYPKYLGWYATSRSDIRNILSGSTCFEAVDGLIPLDVHVFIDWTW